MSGQPLKLRVARWAGLAVRAGRMLTGPAAAAAVSIGAGGLAGHIFGRGLTPWVALAVAGAFGLWIARELNSVQPPPAPHGDDLDV